MTSDDQLLAALGDELVGSLDVNELAAGVIRAVVPALAGDAAVYWDVRDPDAAYARAHDEPHVERVAASAGWAHEAVDAHARALIAGGTEPGRLRDALVARLEVPPPAVGVVAFVAPAETIDQPAWRALATEIVRRVSRAFTAAVQHHDALHKLEARNDLIAMLSHDVRNALGTASMNCQLLAGRWVTENAPSNVRRQVDAIKRSVDWMTELVDDLLDQRALEIEPRAPEPRATEALPLCRDAIALHESRAGTREVTLVLDEASRDVSVLADRTPVIQVLDNLIANALTVAPAHSQVVLKVEESGGAQVRFSVKDSGPGIDLADRDAGALFRGTLRRPETRGGRGRGLGLPIAHALVQAQGGRIWVETRSGAGSTFYFTLPAAPANGT
jgi:signal transduction histidine kinase